MKLFFLFSATILETMRRDGNVLICVDTAGRVLELALLLVRILISTIFLYFVFLLGTIMAE